MSEPENHPWKLRFEITEDDQHCEMVVHLDTGLQQLTGEGRSRRNPIDPNMPRVGDVMIYKKDKSLSQVGQFTAQIQTLDIPGEIKAGYSPIGFVRCGRSACRATAFNFKVGKETGGKKMDNPHSLKSNEMAEVVFVPQQPLVVDSFKNCEGLSRIAFLDGNTAVMLGKVTKTVSK